MMSYQNLLKEILNTRDQKDDRTGTGTLSLFGEKMMFNLAVFPLVTTKKMFFKGIVHELLWMLRGETNIRSLQEVGVKIWDEWADEKGNLGPVYGAQWRRWKSEYFWKNGVVIDQISNLVEGIRENPNSRRHIVTAWNPNDIDDQALPPCHCFFQVHIREGYYLDLQMYQRSADVFLGVPFNIASYALLTMMLAQVTGYKPGVFHHIFGDVHIYNNHIEQVKTLLRRSPFNMPEVKINPDIKEIEDFKFEDFELNNYMHHDAIKAPVAV